MLAGSTWTTGGFWRHSRTIFGIIGSIRNAQGPDDCNVWDELNLHGAAGGQADPRLGASLQLDTEQPNFRLARIPTGEGVGHFPQGDFGLTTPPKRGNPVQVSDSALSGQSAVRYFPEDVGPLLGDFLEIWYHDTIARRRRGSSLNATAQGPDMPAILTPRQS